MKKDLRIIECDICGTEISREETKDNLEAIYKEGYSIFLKKGGELHRCYDDVCRDCFVQVVNITDGGKPGKIVINTSPYSHLKSPTKNP